MLLPEEQAIALHQIIDQTLFMSAKDRRDIQTAVGFSTTRIKNPEKDNWGKLNRVLKYLN